ASDVVKLAEHSDLILLGHVEKIASRWDGGKIVTDATVRVEQTVKGAPTRAVVVSQPGGRVGDIVMRVLGGAEFHAGDRSILFLKQAGPSLRVVGLAQGKLDVRRNGAGVEVVTWVPAGAAAADTVPLAGALARLRTLVQKP